MEEGALEKEDTVKKLLESHKRRGWLPESTHLSLPRDEKSFRTVIKLRSFLDRRKSAI